MSLEEVKQSLIDGTFEIKLDEIREFSNEEAFQVIGEDYHQPFIEMKKKKYYQPLMFQLIIFLICLSNNIELKQEYCHSYNIQDDFVSRYMKKRCISEENIIFMLNRPSCFWQSIFIIFKRAWKMNIKFPFNAGLIRAIVRNKVNEKFKDYLFDNSKPCDLDSLLEYEDFVLDEMLKRDKVAIKTNFTKCIFIYCLIFRYYKIIDIALKHKTCICPDRFDVTAFIMSRSHRNHFQGSISFNISLDYLEKLSSLENFDDFLKNNYKFFTEDCNQEVMDYINNII